MNRALDYLVVALAMAMIGVGAVGAYDLLTQPAIAGQKAPVGIPGPFGPPLGERSGSVSFCWAQTSGRTTKAAPTRSYW